MHPWSTVCAAKPVPPSALFTACPVAAIPFETTAASAGVRGVVGQDRAARAVRFGASIRRPGYNLFAVGPPGVGKQTLLHEFLDRLAATLPTPSDWCYVHDFDDPSRPRALELPPGRGARLAGEMARATIDLQLGMRAATESEEYRTRKQQIMRRFKERQEEALSALQERAKGRDVALVSADSGLLIAPLHNGTLLDPAGFAKLPTDRREALAAEMEKVGEELQTSLQRFQEWGRERQQELDALDRDIAAGVARRVIGAVRKGYDDLPAVLDHLSRVELDVIESATEILAPPSEEPSLPPALRAGDSDDALSRYDVNLLVDNHDQQGAPVIYEDHPTYANLMGRIEHESQLGALITHFSLIKPGAFHRANGGFLILDAIKVLQEPLAWEAVKRVAHSRLIHTESLSQALGLSSTVSLTPMPISVRHTKVILVGDRRVYHLLAAVDPEFPELFKVLVDFEDHLRRAPPSETQYAELVATLVHKEGLRPFDRDAVARVIEHAARDAEDAERLSLHMRAIVDLLREVDHWAGEAGHPIASALDVQAALDERQYRSDRVRERMADAYRRRDLLLETAGGRVGQVNGLSVFQIGERVYGHPMRISARVRVGKGEVLDIEREVELGGPLHSKGVLILGGLLGAHYAPGVPLSLAATLVIEQSYGGVEGDSASLAELCALLSALAEVPAKQAIAITGSVNQHGEAQSVGGINEKIEGFFDLCLARGLSGEQGVIIPASNVKNLMLRRDVVDAAIAGRFTVYAVETVDDALAVLTGETAGARDATGAFPPGSVNAKVEARLLALATSARTFAPRPRGAVPGRGWKRLSAR